MKSNKLLLNEDEANNTSTIIEDKTNAHNSALFYVLSQIFNLKNLSEVVLLCIQRCFQNIADTDNFQELDFLSVKKILSSDYLNIDS